MKTVNVNTSTAYEVKIGSKLLSSLGSETAAVTKIGTAILVSDTNVWPLYGEIAKESLEITGFHVLSFVFDAGESSKNANTYLELLNFLAVNHVTRQDCLIALGGGVVGDLTGFAAATYLRGIPFIQVPTTLLAAVDSSVGGKTAIDLECGKNLVGAFYQPKLVLCDVDTLDTLPPDIYRDGCAEVIKYGILYDPELFENLLASGMDFERESVIARCVLLKKQVVDADEFEKGSRMMLNLGHTVGHGIEACSHYAISHGCAVAAGMAIVAKASSLRGICSPETAADIERILQKFGLPTQTDFSSQQLTEIMLSDKKRSGACIQFILPHTIGHCENQPIPLTEIESFIKEGL